MNSKIVHQHNTLSSTRVGGHLLKKIAVGELIDGVIDNMECDNPTIHIDGGSDGNRLKAELFLLHHYRFDLRREPYFRLYLICGENRLVHEQKFLLRLHSAQKPWERMQASLCLATQLPLCQLNVHTQNTLLDTMQIVQLPKAIQRDWVFGPATIKRFDTLPKAQIHLKAQAGRVYEPVKLIRG